MSNDRNNETYIKELQCQVQKVLKSLVNQFPKDIKRVELRLQNMLTNSFFSPQYDCDALLVAEAGEQSEDPTTDIAEMPGSFASQNIRKKRPQRWRTVPYDLIASKRFANTFWFPVILNDNLRAGQLIIWPKKPVKELEDYSSLCFSSVRELVEIFQNHIETLSASLREKLINILLDNSDLHWRQILKKGCDCIKETMVDVDDVRFYSVSENNDSLRLEAVANMNEKEIDNLHYNRTFSYDNCGFVGVAACYRENIRCRIGKFNQLKEYYKEKKSGSDCEPLEDVTWHDNKTAVMALPAFVTSEIKSWPAFGNNNGRMAGVFLVGRKKFSKTTLDGFWPCEEIAVSTNLPIITKIINSKRWRSHFKKEIETVSRLLAIPQSKIEEFDNHHELHGDKDLNRILSLISEIRVMVKGSSQGKELSELFSKLCKPVAI